MDDGAARRPGVLARLRAATAGGPLGNRSFQLLSMGQLASTVGDLCYAVALPWLILSNHGGPIELGTILACTQRTMRDFGAKPAARPAPQADDITGPRPGPEPSA